jgi:SAM-dependent methyltransferase
VKNPNVRPFKKHFGRQIRGEQYRPLQLATGETKMVKNHPNDNRLITACAVQAPAIAMVCAQLGWIAIEHVRTEKVVLMLRPVLGGSVLDVGCNDGHLSALLLKKQQDQDATMNITNDEHDKNHQRPQPLTSIYGIDPYLPDRVAIPAGRFDGVNIPARDKQYDVAMANFILHHAGRNATVSLLKEMKRVSRRVVVSEDHVETSLDRVSVMAIHEVMRLVLNMGYDMDGFRTKAEWKRTFEDECGFRVVAQRDYSSSIFLLPCTFWSSRTATLVPRRQQTIYFFHRWRSS